MYIMVEIQYKEDGTASIAPAATYTDPMDALAAFHSRSASLIAAIKAGTIKAALIKTFGDAGTNIADMTTYLNDISPNESQNNSNKVEPVEG